MEKYKRAVIKVILSWMLDVPEGILMKELLRNESIRPAWKIKILIKGHCFKMKGRTYPILHFVKKNNTK